MLSVSDDYFFGLYIHIGYARNNKFELFNLANESSKWADLEYSLTSKFPTKISAKVLHYNRNFYNLSKLDRVKVRKEILEQARNDVDLTSIKQVKFVYNNGIVANLDEIFNPSFIAR